MRHISYLLNVERTSRGVIHFTRVNDTTISVSCSGYKHMDLYEVHRELLKLGCRYDHKRGVEKFDPVCGRTFSYFVEPAKGE